MAKITIPLPLHASRSAITRNRVSADNYRDTINSAMAIPDIVWTYAVRYDQVVENDILNSVTGKAKLANFFSYHPTALGLLLGIALLGGFINAVRVYSNHQTLKNNNDYFYLYKQFEKIHNGSKQEKACYLSEIMKLHHADFIFNFKNFMIENENLIIEIEAPTQNKPSASLYTRMIRIKDFILNKIANPLWEALGISSFTYWLMWLSIGLVKGDYGSNPMLAIQGVPNILSFGIPLAFGAVYIFLKIGHWIYDKIYQYQFNKKMIKNEALLPTIPPDVMQQAKNIAQDVAKLLRLAILYKKIELNAASTDTTNKITKNRNVISSAPIFNKKHFFDEKIQDNVGRHQKIKTAITFLTNMVGSYVVMQYSAWIIGDFLKFMFGIFIPGIELVSGIAMIAVAASIGIYQAFQKWQALKHDKIRVEQQNLDYDLETQKLENNLKTLKNELRHAQQATLIATADDDKAVVKDMLNYIPKKSFLTKETNLNSARLNKIKNGFSKAFALINGICTGIFMGRLFLIAKTATILPFIAAAFSPPITIGLIVGIGLIYGLIKLYQYHITQNETHALALLANRSEHILEMHEEISTMQKIKHALNSFNLSNNQQAVVSTTSEEQSPLSETDKSTISPSKTDSDQDSDESLAPSPSMPRSRSF